MLFSCLFGKNLAQSMYSSIEKIYKSSELFADYCNKPTILQRVD